MTELPKYVDDLIKDIATTEGFTEYTIKTAPGSNHGDNFSGVLISVCLHGTRIVNGTSSEDQLNLLCKLSAPGQRGKEFQTEIIFKREAFMYEKVLSTFAKFQQEKGLSTEDSFLAYPKYYAGISDESKQQFVIIMEDVRFRNFAMWPKYKPAPLDHVRLLVQQIGKFHGISFALKDQQPEVFAEFRQLKDVLVNFFRKTLSMLHSSYDAAIAAVEKDEHKQIVQEVKDNTVEFLSECLESGEWEPFGVVCHADCWNNNLLFEYKNEVIYKKKAFISIDLLFRNNN